MRRHAPHRDSNLHAPRCAKSGVARPGGSLVLRNGCDRLVHPSPLTREQLLASSAVNERLPERARRDRGTLDTDAIASALWRSSGKVRRAYFRVDSRFAWSCARTIPCNARHRILQPCEAWSRGSAPPRGGDLAGAVQYSNDARHAGGIAGRTRHHRGSRARGDRAAAVREQAAGSRDQQAEGRRRAEPAGSGDGGRGGPVRAGNVRFANRERARQGRAPSIG